MHPETYELLVSLLTMLRDRGEDETFAHIRQLLREERKKELACKNRKTGLN